MKIQDAKTFIVRNPPPSRGGPYFIFVKLITDNEITGYGEVYGVPFHPSKVAGLVEDVVARHVIDWDPFNIERLWRIVYSDGYTQHPDLTTSGILSGIEMACWDIAGKALGQPVYNLLGGKAHEKLRSYTYLYDGATDVGQPEAAGTSSKEMILQHSKLFQDPARACARALKYVKAGFTAVKFDPVMPMTVYDPRQLTLEELETAEIVTRSLREAVGSQCDLLFGTHGQMTTASAIRLARRLEPFDPLWFEEPVPPENRTEMARVARATSIPVACGERLATKYDFAEVLEKKSAAILQPALGRVGGILEAKKIAGMAEAHYVQLAPHLYCGPLEAAANIQVATCSPNFLILESIEQFGGMHAKLLKKPIDWQNGYVIPPTDPGLGYELDENVALEYAYDNSENTVYPPMMDEPLIKER